MADILSTHKDWRDYRILGAIGEGSFGKVFKIVALKFIPKRGKSEKELFNLRQEISILRNLRHDNIVHMLDAIETKKSFCLITEYAIGELFEILEDDKKFSEKEICKIAKQLVNALKYLHEKKIIHRDMKPQNILISSNGVIKLCDFGFARVMSDRTFVLTSIKGTPLYMAPELVQEKPYNRTVDLWSLGVILYELYVGKPPFYTNNFYSLIQYIVKDPVKYPRTISKNFKSFLQGLLSKEPSKRLDWGVLEKHPFLLQTFEEESDERTLNVKTREASRRELIEKLYYPETFSQLNFDSDMYGPRKAGLQTNTPRDSSKGLKKKIKRKIRKKIGEKRKKLDLNAKDLKQEDVGPGEGGVESPTHAKGFDKFCRGGQFDVKNLDNPQFVSLIKQHLKQKKDCQEGLQMMKQIFLLLQTGIAKGSESNVRSFLFFHRESKIFESVFKFYKKREFKLLVLDIVLAAVKGNMTQEGKIFDMEPLLNEWFAKSEYYLVTPRKGNIRSVLQSVRIMYFCVKYLHIHPTDIFHKIVIEKNLVPKLVGLLGCEESKITSEVLKCLYQLVHRMKNGSSNFTGFPSMRAPNHSTQNANLNETLGVIYEDRFRDLAGQALLGERVYLRTVLGFSKNSKLSIYSLIVLFHVTRKNKRVCSVLQNGHDANFICEMIPYFKSASLEKKTVLLHIFHNLYPSSGFNKKMLTLLEQLFKDIDKSNDCIYFCSILRFLMQCDIGLYAKFFTQPKVIDKCLKVVESIKRYKNRKRIEGIDSMEGIPSIGVLDGFFSLFLKLTVRENFLNLLLTHRNGLFTRVVAKVLGTTEPLKGEVSPVGCIASVKLLQKLADKHPAIHKNSVIVRGVLCTFFNEQVFSSFLRFPDSRGGGFTSSVDILCCVAKFLRSPFSVLRGEEMELTRSNEPLYEDVCVHIQEMLLQENFVQNAMLLLNKYLSKNSFKDGNQLKTSSYVMDLLSKLVLRPTTQQPNPFARSFIQMVDPRVVESILSLRNLRKKMSGDTLTLYQALMIVLNQVAKTGDKDRNNYGFFKKISVFKHLSGMKNDRGTPDSVKARMCNLIGNLCKHSAQFYQELIHHDLVKDLVSLLEHDDAQIRKFSCFAIGNAAFHNDVLYPYMKSAVRPLLGLLSEGDERTRGNSAGALGNLIRKSNFLCSALIENGALDIIFKAVSAERSLNVARIIVYSLSNFACYPKMARLLKDKGYKKRLMKVVQNFNGDKLLREYMSRIERKMKSCLIDF